MSTEQENSNFFDFPFEWQESLDIYALFEDYFGSIGWTLGIKRVLANYKQTQGLISSRNHTQELFQMVVYVDRLQDGRFVCKIGNNDRYAYLDNAPDFLWITVPTEVFLQRFPETSESFVRLKPKSNNGLINIPCARNSWNNKQRDKWKKKAYQFHQFT